MALFDHVDFEVTTRPDSSPKGNRKSILPPQRMSLSDELPAELARALREASGDDAMRCGSLGAAGPVVALMFGASDGIGLSEGQRTSLLTSIRQELRTLAQLLDAPQEDAVPASPSMDVFEVVTAWCATPAVPTYDVGLHIALGTQDAKEMTKATNCAWVLR